jgi:CHAT domain-containing protein
VRQQIPQAVLQASALREAALKLISSERHAHPFYWAGFVLIGDAY